jgi:hypothetical protein
MAPFRPRDSSLAYRWPRRRGLCYAARQAGGEVLRNVAQCGSGGKTCPLVYYVIICNKLARDWARCLRVIQRSGLAIVL